MKYVSTLRKMRALNICFYSTLTSAKTLEELGLIAEPMACYAASDLIYEKWEQLRDNFLSYNGLPGYTNEQINQVLTCKKLAMKSTGFDLEWKEF